MNPDVIIIGGGIMGLLLARRLRQRGRSVTIVERGDPGQEASWAAAGMVADPPPDASDPLNAILRRSGQLFPQLGEDLAQETGQNIGWNPCGWLMLAWSDSQARNLREQGLLWKEQGQKVEIIEGSDVQRYEPELEGNPEMALRVSGACVDPRNLCSALVTSVELAGVCIRRQEPAKRVTFLGKEGRFRVVTPRGRLEAAILVLAAGPWSGILPGLAFRPPVRPQKGQILTMKLEGLDLRHVILDYGKFPYLVPRGAGRVLCGATREDTGFDRGLTAGGIASLKAAAARMVPRLAQAKILETWTGLRPVSIDGLPLIGAGSEKGFFLMTGHGADGIALAPGSAEILAEMICGEAPGMDLRPLDPLRFCKG